MKRVVLLGPPGAGKGTQAKMIAARYEIPHISTGDIFRANIKEGTELGNKAKAFMDQGLLVPDELTLELIMDRFSKDDCRNGYVLDGFPRTIPQAEELTKALAAAGEDIDYAIDIEVPDEVIVERMGGRRVCPKCGASYHVTNVPPKKEGICDNCGGPLIQRPDDNEAALKVRLTNYYASTKPLLGYYEAMKVLSNVDGMKGADQVLVIASKLIEE